MPMRETPVKKYSLTPLEFYYSVSTRIKWVITHIYNICMYYIYIYMYIHIGSSSFISGIKQNIKSIIQNMLSPRYLDMSFVTTMS